MNPLIVALDISFKETKKIVSELSPHIEIFKVGSRLFTEAGPKALEWIHQQDRKIFLDLKFHDIPQTVKESCRNAAKMGVWGLTIHSWGGYDMMNMASTVVKEESERIGVSPPLVFGVTVLTSFAGQDLSDLGLNTTPLSQVERLAGLAKRANLDGVVASGEEIEIIRKTCGKDFKIVVPGIRLNEPEGKEDQKRVATPREALRLGANYLVVGRPILNEKNRVEAARRFLSSLQ